PIERRSQREGVDILPAHLQVTTCGANVADTLSDVSRSSAAKAPPQLARDQPSERKGRSVSCRQFSNAAAVSRSSGRLALKNGSMGWSANGAAASRYRAVHRSTLRIA